MLFPQLSMLKMSRISTRNMGQQRNPKSPAAHCTARSEALWPSTVFLVGVKRITAAFCSLCPRTMQLGSWLSVDWIGPNIDLSVQPGFSIAVLEAPPRIVPGCLVARRMGKPLLHLVPLSWTNFCLERLRARPRSVYILVYGRLDGGTSCLDGRWDRPHIPTACHQTLPALLPILIGQTSCCTPLFDLCIH